MHVVALQLASSPDPDLNRAHVEASVTACEGAPDLVVLPEACQVAFGDRPSPLARGAEALDGPFVSLLASLSAAGPTIVAGMFERSHDPARPYNSTVVLSGGELVAAYRKIHLYDALGFLESDGISPGPADEDNLVVLDVGGCAVGIMTCFDLRFPEISAALVDRGAQVLALGAAWVPGPRKVEQWSSLLAARSIETTSFVVAAAQPEPRYCGHSSILDPTGQILAEAGVGAASISADLDLAHLADVRAAMPVLRSRRLRTA